MIGFVLEGLLYGLGITTGAYLLYYAWSASRATRFLGGIDSVIPPAPRLPSLRLVPASEAETLDEIEEAERHVSESGIVPSRSAIGIDGPPTLKAFPRAPSFIDSDEHVATAGDMHVTVAGGNVLLLVFGADASGESGRMVTLTMAPAAALDVATRLREAGVTAAYADLTNASEAAS